LAKKDAHRPFSWLAYEAYQGNASQLSWWELSREYVGVSAGNSELGTIQNRYVYFALDGRKPRVYNAYFSVDGSKRSRGVGAEIFFPQVEASAKAKFDSISLTAARGSGRNGYYTCARFGYDATISELNPSLRVCVREKFPDAQRVSDIMKSKQGRDKDRHRRGQSIFRGEEKETEALLNR
jgi:hypothetical protein